MRTKYTSIIYLRDKDCPSVQGEKVPKAGVVHETPWLVCVKFTGLKGRSVALISITID